MGQQQSLFGDADDGPQPTRYGAYGKASAVGAPWSRPGTSKAAAEAIVPLSAARRAAVLAFLRQCGERGATGEEIEAGTGLPGNTIRPRLIELREDGLVADSGRTRKTKSDRSAMVWIATQ